MRKRAKVAAGLLMYRLRDGELEVFLVHPGGPLFAKKDSGVWTLPKGEPDPDEVLIDTARREFNEETGLTAGQELLPLGQVTQKGGKVVHGWAFAGEWDPADGVTSNTFEMEWPPRSGRMCAFPEIDRGGFFTPEAAWEKINVAQREFVTRLVAALAAT